MLDHLKNLPKTLFSLLLGVGLVFCSLGLVDTRISEEESPVKTEAIVREGSLVRSEPSAESLVARPSVYVAADSVSLRLAVCKQHSDAILARTEITGRNGHGGPLLA